MDSSGCWTEEPPHLIFPGVVAEGLWAALPWASHTGVWNFPTRCDKRLRCERWCGVCTRISDVRVGRDPMTHRVQIQEWPLAAGRSDRVHSRVRSAPKVSLEIFKFMANILDSGGLCIKNSDFWVFFFFGHAYSMCNLTSPIKDRTRSPLQGKQRVLTTGPPGKSSDFPCKDLAALSPCSCLAIVVRWLLPSRQCGHQPPFTWATQCIPVT